MAAKALGYTSLCKAIDGEEVDTIRLLIRSGASLNLLSPNPVDSPLHKSIRKFIDPEIIELLLKNGANTTLKNRKGKTPLDVAVQVENKRALALLIKYGNYKLAEISKVLKTASSMCHSDVEELIMKHEPRWIPTKLLSNKSKKASLRIYQYFKDGYKVHSSSKITAFDLAYRFAEFEHVGIFEQIVKSGININQYNPRTGFTLLHLACVKQNEKLVSLLIKHKANLNLEVRNVHEKYSRNQSTTETKVMAGRTALYITLEKLNITITKLLLNSGALITSEPDLMKIAIEKKDKQMILLLLSCGIKINEANFEGITPLHHSIVSGTNIYKSTVSDWEIDSYKFNNDDDKYPIVELLLEHGADVNAQTNERKLTPLHMAVEKNYINISKLLLMYKANTNLVDSDNYTPFYVAIIKKRELITDIFLESDIDFNFKNDFGSTALHVSCATGNIKAVNMLLKKKIHINCVDKYGKTPLHNACESGNFKVINRLLDYAVNIKIKNTFEQTPFHILAKLRTMNSYDSGDDLTELCERFIRMGADINLGDVEKKTPLFIACSHGCNEIVKVLLNHKANIHTRDVFNRPPVYMAAGKPARNTGILKLLVDKGANPNYIDTNSNTIFHIAAAANNLDFDEIVDKIDVDINMTNSEGDTALHIALKNGFFEVVHALLNNGADITITNAENKTPVHIATDKIKKYHDDIESLRDYLGLDEYVDNNRTLYSGFGIDEYKSLIEWFHSLSIQMHKANFYVHPKIFELIRTYTDKDISDYERACTQELERMKEVRVSGTSLYNLLTCSIHDISKFAENQSVQAAIMNIDKLTFRIYRNTLMRRFKQGIMRNKWVKFIQLYHSSNLSIFKGLPYSCVDQILQNFNIKDILLFMNTITGRYNELY